MIIAVDDDRNPLPCDGESVGELAVLSPSAFAGYWENPVATDAVLEGGWYFSGDVGSIDENGYVYIADRRTNMILSGGANIYPAELEMVIDRCPGIVECAVVAGPHPRWGQTPVAVVVREEGAELTEEQVIDYARERLASYKKPTRVIFVDQIPRTTGGKTARGRLKDQLADVLTQAQS
jgi:acyl-CoA synthetase (AMP-forming)/AMP-acid ligase II